jgi:hypothetical protein
MTVELKLTVNDSPIFTDYFVAGFLDHTISGMVESLEGTGEIKHLKYSIDGEKVTINLNGKEVPINEFVTKIFKSTTYGILTSLKGVTSPIRKVELEIKK